MTSINDHRYGKTRGDTTPSGGSTHELMSGSLSAAAGNDATIYYLCPDTHIQSAGIRRLYRHVALLTKNGFDAHILHLKSGFFRKDLGEVSVKHLDRMRFRSGEIVVIPEGCPTIMEALKDQPIRRLAIALNWDYIFKAIKPGVNWRSFNIERVITVSAPIAEMISWAMNLPTHVLASSIDRDLYYVDPGVKVPNVVYIARKGAHAEYLKRLICSRNSIFHNNIKWIGIDSLSEAEYAEAIREAAVFLNLSLAEGYPTSCLEAMASGTLVATYASMGQGSLLQGEGAGQNCLMSPIGDYPSLARQLEPLLSGMAAGEMQQWNRILANGAKTVSNLSIEVEESVLVRFWRSLLSDRIDKVSSKESMSL